jgi:hypothetical protein
MSTRLLSVCLVAVADPVARKTNPKTHTHDQESHDPEEK